MVKKIFHRDGLEALLTVATSPQRWRTQAELARDCGFSPATFSHALRGSRGMSDEALASMSDVLGIDAHAALSLPWMAQPGDLRTEVVDRRLRDVQDELTSLHRAFIEHQRKT